MGELLAFDDSNYTAAWGDLEPRDRPSTQMNVNLIR